MRVTSSLSIDRTGLSLSPLVLNNDPFTGAFTYPEDGLAEPVFPPRVSYAPDSQWIPGRLALGSVLDAGSIPLSVYVRGTSAANLQTLKVELLTALVQLSYDVTMTVDGVEVGTWPAFPASVAWGVVDHGMAQRHLALATISIPVNPVEA